ncbi:MAG: Omp28-related outer membrane protein [Bacteroidetes bacterium]|nr:Omp28-related outer membrane protein [Bacteroidota bacterium]
MRKILTSVLLFSASFSTIAQTTVSTSGNKYVLMEATGAAWSGWETDGIPYLDTIKSTYPKAIVVQNHFQPYGDKMAVSDCDTWQHAYVGGAPMATVDRTVNNLAYPTIGIGRNYYYLAIVQRLAATAKYDVSMTYTANTSTRTINITLTGTALASLSGDYNFNVYVVEDSVTDGYGGGYDQNNYMNTTVGHKYFGAGNPIVGFKHMQVVRAMLGGTWGVYGVTSPSASTSTTKTFTYIVPAGYKMSRIRLVGMVMKYNASNVNDREVMNAVKSPMVATASGCPAPRVVPICIVAKDSATNKNKVIWEKTGVTYAMQYKIYRETPLSSGIYTLLGSQPSNAFSTYLDTTSYPDSFSYRYKLVMVDSCSNEVPWIDTSVHAHRTVFLTSTLSGTSVILNWNLYEGRPFTSAVVMEQVGSGPYTPIATLSPTATTYTISSAPSGAVYRLDVVVPGGCSPSKTTADYYVSSNIVYPFGVPTGVNAVINNENKIHVYPSPATDYVHISGIADGDHISVYDMTGKRIINMVADKGIDLVNIYTGEYSKGHYLIRVSHANGEESSVKFEKL